MGVAAKLRSISVLIPDGGHYDTLKVLRCLGQVQEITTHILSRVRWPISRFSRYSAKCHHHKSQTDADWIDYIIWVAKRWNIDVVLPVTMKGTELLSLNRKNLSDVVAIPPIPESQKLKIAQDKWTFYRFAEEHKLPVLPTILVADGKRIVADTTELNSIKYPAILKPTAEMGGLGIVKINSPSEFYHSVEQKSILNEGHKYILQSYIPGVDFCLGVLCKSGKISAYTLQRNLIPSENRFSYQKVMDFIHNDSIIELGTQFVSAIAWNGIAFIDFRIDKRDKKAKFLEVNPRIGRALLGSLIAGVNFPFISCLMALGINYPITHQKTSRYAHPSAYLHMLASNIIGRTTPIRIKWSESGCRFSVCDPLPEIVSLVYRIGSQLKRRITCKRL